MSNYFEYLKWRGDLSFEAAPFCEVDALILSELVYMDMDMIASPEFSYNEVDVARLCKHHVLTHNPKGPFEKDVSKLAEFVPAYPRIANIKVCGHVDEVITKEEHKQFAAATFRISDELAFVAYRGTDDTLVGWKENMDLAYFEETPSQKDAVKYLEKAAKEMSVSFITGGHSKGGNLAVYATAFCENAVSDRVTAIYNFDGPGFNDLVIAKDQFKDIMDRIHTYVPQNSLIGLLLKHQEPYTVIKSTKSSGINEHMVSTWEVGPNSLIREEGLGNMGKALNENIQEWIDSMTYEEKREFIETAYDLVDDFSTVDDLTSPKNLVRIIKTYSDLSEENKKKISDALGNLADTVKDNILDFFR